MKTKTIVDASDTEINLCAIEDDLELQICLMDGFSSPIILDIDNARKLRTWLTSAISKLDQRYCKRE